MAFIRPPNGEFDEAKRPKNKTHNHKEKIMAHKIQRYGWVPDLPDLPDQLYSAPVAALQAMRPALDLTSQCPPVYDQGQLGSCTANAIAGAIER